jgi:hypothetical protein
MALLFSYFYTMRNILFIAFFSLFVLACKHEEQQDSIAQLEVFLNLNTANKLVKLPLSCVSKEYPNKLGQVISSDKDLLSPEELHPIFYGCFDWHSAVHGYWSLVYLYKRFPNLERANELESQLKQVFTAENIQKEMAYFDTPLNENFERTYGWSWLLKLDQELNTWNTPFGDSLSNKLRPLTELIVEKYKGFLPKLNYALRVGTHTNTAFGLNFAFDWATYNEDFSFLKAIEERAVYFYGKDKNCPLSWEPSGTDFLSPCLEEAVLMKKVLPKNDFSDWLKAFLPQLFNQRFKMDVGEVSDRSDGHLVHLDGLNFSRSWCLFKLAKDIPALSHLNAISQNHFEYAYPNLIGDDYMGGHWLASFAIYALEIRTSAQD